MTFIISRGPLPCRSPRLLPRLTLALSLALALTAVTPGAGLGQDTPWRVWLAPQLTRSLGAEGGSDLGALGGSLQVLHGGPSPGWAWGGAVTLHRLGTFQLPDVPVRENRSIGVGVRGIRAIGTHRWFLTLGGDVLAVQERNEQPAGGAWSSDPGIGAYLGVGWSGTDSEGGPGLFFESGLTGALATGENTVGGGVWLSVKCGLVL